MDSVFRDPRAVRRDLRAVPDFYNPTVIDTRFGGYVPEVSDRDGTVDDARPEHLVPTCRLVFDLSVGALVGGPDWCRTAAEHVPATGPSSSPLERAADALPSTAALRHVHTDRSPVRGRASSHHYSPSRRQSEAAHTGFGVGVME